MGPSEHHDVDGYAYGENALFKALGRMVAGRLPMKTVRSRRSASSAAAVAAAATGLDAAGGSLSTSACNFHWPYRMHG